MVSFMVVNVFQIKVSLDSREVSSPLGHIENLIFYQPLLITILISGRLSSTGSLPDSLIDWSDCDNITFVWFFTLILVHVNAALVSCLLFKLQHLFIKRVECYLHGGEPIAWFVFRLNLSIIHKFFAFTQKVIFDHAKIKAIRVFNSSLIITGMGNPLFHLLLLWRWVSPWGGSLSVLFAEDRRLHAHEASSS
jgi:hypothetical protein